jgi:hypothetical protein
MKSWKAPTTFSDVTSTPNLHARSCSLGLLVNKKSREMQGSCKR